jgi:hypothetical protein
MFEIGGKPFKNNTVYFDYMYYEDNNMDFIIKYRYLLKCQRNENKKLIRKTSKKPTLDTIFEY